MYKAMVPVQKSFWGEESKITKNGTQNKCLLFTCFVHLYMFSTNICEETKKTKKQENLNKSAEKLLLPPA